MRKWISLTPVVAAYAFSAAVYGRLAPSARADFSPLLPFRLSAGGEIPRAAAAFLVPTVALAVWVLVLLGAKVRGPVRGLPQWWINEDVGSASISRFEPTFDAIIFALMSLLALAHIVLVGAYLGWPVSMYQLATALLGIGIIGAGNVVPRVKPNWMMGLRTKRTLSDRATWARTHRILGALMMTAGATVVIVSVAAPRYALIWSVVALLMALVLSHFLGTRPSEPAGMQAR